MGSWSLRIDFIAGALRARGHQCLLLNIGASRKQHITKYINVGGPLDYLVQVFKLVRQGFTLHTHTNAKGIKGTLLAFSAQLVSLLMGRHNVLTFHAGLFQQYFPITGNLLLDWLMKLTFLTPRYIICNSEAIKKKIVEDYEIDGNKIFPIPAFCAAYMQTGAGALTGKQREFAQKHAPLLVTYVFFFHPEFMVDKMILAVERLKEHYPDLGLIIMGSMQYVDDYLPMIEQLGLNEHILIAGNLPRDEFLGVLKAGSLYLRTPMGDGVAASVLEALSIGTPVVASNNGTRPAGCVLYKSDDLEDMIEKIQYVLDNRLMVVSQIEKPEGDDTVNEEVELLLKA